MKRQTSLLARIARFMKIAFCARMIDRYYQDYCQICYYTYPYYGVRERF